MSGPKCEEAHSLLSRGWLLKEKLGHLKGEFVEEEFLKEKKKKEI